MAREEEAPADAGLTWFLVVFLVGVMSGAGGLVALRRVPPAAIVITPAVAPTAAPTETPAPLTVYVHGAVVAAGMYTLAPGSRLETAIARAGGVTSAAATAWVNLAQPLQDGMQVYVPTAEEVGAAWPATGVTADGATAGRPAGKININTADQTALESLPRIGPSTAQKIIAYRDANGPFASVDGLLDVRGIGEATLSGLRELVTVGE